MALPIDDTLPGPGSIHAYRVGAIRGSGVMIILADWCWQTLEEWALLTSAGGLQGQQGVCMESPGPPLTLSTGGDARHEIFRLLHW